MARARTEEGDGRKGLLADEAQRESSADHELRFIEKGATP